MNQSQVIKTLTRCIKYTIKQCIAQSVLIITLWVSGVGNNPEDFVKRPHEREGAAVDLREGIREEVNKNKSMDSKIYGQKGPR
jgi:hypothetical protein